MSWRLCWIRMKKAGYEFEILFPGCRGQCAGETLQGNHAEAILWQWGEEWMTESGWKEKRCSFLKERADYIIDTSHLLTRELKQEIERIFVAESGFLQYDDFCAVLWV